MDIVTYLLPLSGQMLLKKISDQDFITIQAAFIPESYYTDCETSIQYLENNNIPYKIPDKFNQDIQSWMNNFKIDVGVSVGYDKRLPDWAFNYPSFGTLNLHPSLLPRYRGANPYFWVIKNREPETGVTIHKMDEYYDTGPILRQSTTSLSPQTNMGELFHDLNSNGIDMMIEILRGLNAGKEVEIHEQPAAKEAPRAPKVQNSDLRIDWDQSYEDIDAHVRAANPHFGAFTTFKGTKLNIFETSLVTDETVNKEDNESTGTIKPTEDGPIVRCNNGWVLLEVVQVNQQYKLTGKSFQMKEKRAFDVLDRVI